MTNILLVEDEASLSEPLAFLLQKEGYGVTIAGKHAVVLGRSNIVGVPISQLLLQVLRSMFQMPQA